MNLRGPRPKLALHPGAPTQPNLVRSPHSILLFATLALHAPGAGAGSTWQEVEPAPAIEHVLVISLDTTRRDRLGFHGGGSSTPRMDALARSGAVFESAFTPAPITLPAHATLFTGNYPPRHGVRDNAIFRLAPEATTLAELLAGAGWRTAGFVSAFVLDRAFGIAQGFEHYDDLFQSEIGGVLGEEERDARATTDAVLRWFASRPPATSFLFVHYFDPHHPYAAPEPFASAAAHPYEAEIAFVDSELGRLLEGLGADFLARALVILTADHGESLGEHGEATHGVFVYQSTMAVPLVIAGPGIAPGQRIEGAVSLADVLPTVLELLGIPAPAEVEGRSLVPALRAERALEARPIYLESWLGHYSFGWAPLTALVLEGKKYVRAPRPELYALAEDPRERSNLLRASPELARQWAERSAPLFERFEAQLAPAPTPLSPEERARLAALGYTSSEQRSPPGGRDPKDGIHQLAILERAAKAQARGEHAVAAEIYEQYLAFDPTSRIGLERAGVALSNAGLCEAAVAHLERLLPDRLFPGLPMFHLARCYAELGRTERALELLALIRKENPKFSAAHLFFARYHEALGNEREAAQAYRELLLHWRGDPALRAEVEERIRRLEEE